MLIERLLVSVLNRCNRWIVRTPVRAGLTLGHERSGPHGPVIWPTTRRAEHAVCVGKTGSGKTHFMEWLAWQLMQQGEPFVFLDYHGDATEHLTRLAAT